MDTVLTPELYGTLNDKPYNLRNAYGVLFSHGPFFQDEKALNLRDRVFYILNWIYRYNMEYYWDPISFYCGCIQTIIYIYFFICIYPQLNNENQYQSVDLTKDLISAVDTKENINQKSTYDIPLIHNVV
ncbi:unnamed protein product [Rotaria sp. Silwood1]|nr:unnamed protein product [Rotaria sp. Silwood1]